MCWYAVRSNWFLLDNLLYIYIFTVCLKLLVMFLSKVDLAQAVQFVTFRCRSFEDMAPAKAMKATKAKKVATKAMKGQKAMSKGGLTGELANATELKKAEITKVLNALAEIGAGEVKKTGKFTLPGLCMIKTRQKKATKAGKRIMFGKEVVVKAQPAKTVVKAFPVAALKSQI